MYKAVIVVLLAIFCLTQANATALTSSSKKIPSPKQLKDPADPVLVLERDISGTIRVCTGIASTTYQQLTFSGYNLPSTVIISAGYFEVTVSNNNGNVTGFSKSLEITPVDGKIENLTVYIRVSADLTPNQVTNGMAGEEILIAAKANPGVNSSTVFALHPYATAIILPNPEVKASNQTVCAGASTDDIIFTGTGTSYTWTNNHPEIGLAASGSGNIPAFTAKNPGNMPISATIIVVPKADCTGPPLAFSINVNPNIPPAITASVSNNPTCEGDAVTFTISPVSAELKPKYNWLVNGQPTGAVTPTYTTSTLHNGDQVTCSITSSTNCYTPVISAPIAMVVNPSPQIHFANNVITINQGQSVSLSPAVNGTGSTYLWSPATGLSNVNILNPYAAPTATTTYILTATAINGCKSTASINVIVNGNGGSALHNGYIAIPNTFTPNGDNINDTWSIPQLVYYPNCTVKVFNRYGTIVYQSIGYPNNWDGNMNNKHLPTGTFYYMINLNRGDDPLRSGYVYLLR